MSGAELQVWTTEAVGVRALGPVVAPVWPLPIPRAIGVPGVGRWVVGWDLRTEEECLECLLAGRLLRWLQISGVPVGVPHGCGQRRLQVLSYDDLYCKRWYLVLLYYKCGEKRLYGHQLIVTL